MTENQHEFPLTSEWDGGLWVPASVVRDHELPYRTKLIAGVIHALAHRDGYCRASNGRIAELFSIHPRTVKKDLALLAERGHVQIIGATTTRRLIPVYSHIQARAQTGPSASELGPIRPPTRAHTAPHLGPNGPLQKKGNSKSITKPSAVIDNVLTEFNNERKVHVRNARTLNSKAYEGKVKARLREGWREVDLVRAARGAFATEHHRESGWKYVTPELVYRDTAHVERFLREAEVAVYTDRICGGCGKQFEWVKFIGEQGPRLCPGCTEHGGGDGEEQGWVMGSEDGERLSRLQVQVPGLR